MCADRATHDLFYIHMDKYVRVLHQIHEVHDISAVYRAVRVFVLCGFARLNTWEAGRFDGKN